MISRGFVFYFFLLLLPLTLPAQGLPFIQKYDPETYNNWRQNWAITQDSSQFILIGNGTGIIRYDGVEWNSVHLPKNGIVRSFLRTGNKIYVGGEAEFGIITSDSLNKLKYKGLETEINDDNFSFSNIWSIQQYEKAIYFSSQEGFIKLINDSLSVISFEKELGGYLFKMNEKLLFTVQGEGLAFLEGKKAKIIRGSESYGDDRLYVVLPFSDKTLLISRKQGFMLYDGRTFTPFDTEATDYIKQHKIYRGIYINDNEIALATLTGGIVIINTLGEITGLYTDKDGLPTNIIYGLFVDHEKNLWAATDFGLAKIMRSIPVTKFDERKRYAGIPEFIKETQTVTYIGSTEGLYSISKEDTLSKVTNEISRVYGHFTLNGELFVNTASGIFRIEDKNAIKISDNRFLTVRSDSNSGTFYAARDNKLVNFKIEGSKPAKITSEKVVLEAPARIYNLFVNALHLWITTPDHQILRYSKSGELSGRYSFSDEEVNPEFFGEIQGSLFLGTTKGLYQFDAAQDSFIVQKKFKNPELSDKQVNYFIQCEEDELWFRNNRKNKRAVLKGEEWEFIESPYNLIDEGKAITAMACGSNENIWFGGSEGIYLLTDTEWKYSTRFNTNISGVYLQNDSLVYGGYGEPEKTPVFTYDNNELRFTYSSSSYISPKSTVYRTRLRGYDDGWSNWSNESRKDYTFIPEGTYTFEVQSKNIYNSTGTTDSYTFSILPPWYRTWWAYAFYAFSLLCIIYVAYKIRVNQILKEYEIRNRIADDLHDEISATLTSISFFAEAARQSGKQKEKYVSLIADSAGEAKDKITDIVWAIHPENDDWKTFVAKCKRYVSDLMESSNIDYKFEINSDPDGKMKMQFRQNLWLMYKEALTNIVRHSDAKQVLIRFTFLEDYLEIIIQDNGKGFNNSAEEMGNGIRNIKKRAEEINARANLETVKGSGTRWLFVLKK